jgi:hypothetical protein
MHASRGTTPRRADFSDKEAEALAAGQECPTAKLIKGPDDELYIHRDQASILAAVSAYTLGHYARKPHILLVLLCLGLASP